METETDTTQARSFEGERDIRRDPSRASNEVDQLFDHRLNCWNNLYPGGPIPNHSHDLVLQVKAIWPVGTMHKIPFEGVKAGDIGPRPVVQNAPGVKEKIAPVVDDCICGVVYDFNVPDTPYLVPPRLGDSVIEVDVGSEVVFGDTMFQISSDLLLG